MAYKRRGGRTEISGFWNRDGEFFGTYLDKVEYAAEFGPAVMYVFELSAPKNASKTDENGNQESLTLPKGSNIAALGCTTLEEAMEHVKVGEKCKVVSKGQKPSKKKGVQESFESFHPTIQYSSVPA